MRPSLEKTVKLALLDLPAAVAGEKARSAVVRLARNLPALHWGGVEIHLGGQRDAVDLHVGLSDPTEAQILVAARIADRFPEVTAGWRRIESFLSRWQDATSRLHRSISKVGLEFDLDCTGSRGRLPAIFWSFSESLQQEPSGQAAVETVTEILALLYGRPPHPAMRETVSQCLKNRPPGTVPFHAGTRPGAGTMALRLNLWGIDPSAAPLDLSPPLDCTGFAADRLPPAVAAAVDTAVLAVDIVDAVMPDIGMECVPHRSKAGVPDWEKLLAAAAQSGLCEAQEAQALLLWPGIRTPVESDGHWPAELIFEGLLAGTDVFGAFHRSLSHIKIGLPAAGRLSAKAYLQYAHKWERAKTTSRKRAAKP